MAQPQNLKNHARYVPLYHFVLVLLLVALLAHASRDLVRSISQEHLFNFGVGLALLLTAWFARSFALTAQDRVIRLEMKLRLQAIAPAQAARFAEFTPGQLTALRFAGDGELAALAQRVLDGQLRTSAQIKEQVQDWQADHLRV